MKLKFTPLIKIHGMEMTIPVTQEMYCFTNTLLSSSGYHVYWQEYCFNLIFLGVHCQVCGRKHHFLMHVCQTQPCHNLSGQLLASHLRSPGSILGQSVSSVVEKVFLGPVFLRIFWFSHFINAACLSFIFKLSLSERLASKTW